MIHKSKGKGHPIRGHQGPKGEKSYSSTLSLTSALDWGGWSTPHPGRFTLGKDPYPLYRILGGPKDRSGRVRKISPPPPGFDPQTVQTVASLYTDCANATLYIYDTYCRFIVPAVHKVIFPFSLL